MLLMVITLPTSLIVLLPLQAGIAEDVLDGDALTLALVACGAFQAWLLWLLLRGPRTLARRREAPSRRSGRGCNRHRGRSRSRRSRLSCSWLADQSRAEHRGGQPARLSAQGGRRARLPPWHRLRTGRAEHDR
ncbi:hypothetical protein [Nonomuraea sp. CA-141351]|uniref:SCO4225 family membrane protein n=1 Tax=Nonomuraea sp. CA-141351 TaxID=3239996 RepID=UPI003D8B9106